MTVPRRPLPQLGLFEGMKARDKALDDIEQKHQEWVDKARRVAMVIVAMHGEVTTDDLRTVSPDFNLDAPPHSNCWGAIFRERAGWEVIGRRRSTVPSNHGREIKIWTKRR